MRMCIMTAALVALLAAPVAGADGDPVSIDLKSFTFKVAEAVTSLFGYDEGEGRLFYYTNGPGEAAVKLPADGEYEITVSAACTPAENERAKFKLAIDGAAVGQETLLTADEPTAYKFTVPLKAGERKLVIEFTNDVYKENEFDRNLFIHAVTLKRKP